MNDDLFGNSKPTPSPKKSPDYHPRLKDGMDLREARSGLQKYIRRGREKEAMALSLSIAESGFFQYLLVVYGTVLLEDVGPANLSLISSVNSILAWWAQVYKTKGLRCDFKQPIAACVILMCRAKKSRIFDDFSNVVIEARKQGYRVELADFCFDGHTAKGRALGRGVKYWARVSSKVTPRATQADIGGEDYSNLMRRLNDQLADPTEPEWEEWEPDTQDNMGDLNE